MNADEILAKIHAGPYWRVNILPATFKEERVSSLRECKEIVERSRVMLRGWDYPHIDERTGGIQTFDGWIESACDWEEHQYEIWRFYQSGQFVHQFSCSERFYSLRRAPAPQRFILVHGVLYTMTEVFEFAAGLARARVLEPTAVVEVELNGIQGYELTFDSLQGAFFRGHIAKGEPIKRKLTASGSELTSRAADLALEQSIAVFERFDWLDWDRRFLAEEQAKLLERRLGVFTA